MATSEVAVQWYPERVNLEPWSRSGAGMLVLKDSSLLCFIIRATLYRFGSPFILCFHLSLVSIIIVSSFYDSIKT